MRQVDQIAAMLTCVANIQILCVVPIFFPVLQLTGEDPDRFADPEDDEEEEGVPDAVHPSS